MLCNVIVRATNDLHVYQKKSADEITMYLNEDCENIGNVQLVEQCHEMIFQHSVEIHKHIVNGVNMLDICKMIKDDSEIALDNEKSAECSNEDGNKCQCCLAHIKKRKIRFHFIVKRMAKKRMHMCRKSSRPHHCRHWVRRKERHILKKIDMICPHMVCKHLGYCTTAPENDSSIKILTESNKNIVQQFPSFTSESIEQHLEVYLTQDVCNKFDNFQALCVHIVASSDSHRYTKIYMTVLDNDTKWFDNDLRKEAQLTRTTGDMNQCDECNSAIQSSKDFYLQKLETVHNALENICKQCRGKEKCEEYFNELIDTFKTYLNSLIPNQVCTAMHQCFSSPPIILIPANVTGDCTVCVKFLQPRKDAALQAIDRLSTYFTDLYIKLNMPQYQQLVSEITTEARLFINEFNVQDTCMIMGLCEPNAIQNVNDYEQAFVQEIGKKLCSTLGPFDALCQQIVEGNVKQVQMISINATSIGEFFTDFEEKTDGDNAVDTVDDKCQCCKKRMIQKKKCAKKRVAKFISHMLELCKRCPVQEKCEHHWEEKKRFWDAKIDKICPKKACIRMGFCTKIDMSFIHPHIKPFNELGQQAVKTVAQMTAESSHVMFSQPKLDDKKPVERILN
ncbi:unnamed protein product [Adineta steineri]|uniref:Saposin B-type domain-containing protein n=1 Tax=Adineta steineri TaxID=433720 RepID=A0A815X4U0_9BILA|nr:unnamed protein product [Adineta steineri]CAF1552627.1 unnamed protein product [Adineta steineri]